MTGSNTLPKFSVVALKIVLGLSSALAIATGASSFAGSLGTHLEYLSASGEALPRSLPEALDVAKLALPRGIPIAVRTPNNFDGWKSFAIVQSVFFDVRVHLVVPEWDRVRDSSVFQSVAQVRESTRSGLIIIDLRGDFQPEKYAARLVSSWTGGSIWVSER